MSKNPIKLSATLLGMALVAFTSCEDQDFTDVNNDATREYSWLSYVPYVPCPSAPS